MVMHLFYSSYVALPCGDPRRPQGQKGSYMERCWVTCAAMLVAALIALDADCGSKPDGKKLARQVDEVFAEWSVPGSPGGAVVLTDGGTVVLQRCYGLASIENGTPIGPATRFELASVSKLFTAFAVLLLEKERKLSLEDDIQKYLPELPDYGSRISVADLLHHTSGLSDWLKARAYAGRPAYGDFDIKDLLSLVARQRMLEFTPGSKFSYSNTNYALLAEIVARVSGKPFGEWMRENVFEPLGMRDTSIPASGASIIPNRAQAYRRVSRGQYGRSLVEDFEIPGPAHVFATIDDMAKWLDNLRTGRLGGPELIEKMRRKTTLTSGQESFYGAGVGIGEYRGIETIGHSGQTGAFKTELVSCPGVGVGVAVLANAGWMRADDLARRVLDLYLGDRLEPAPAAAPSAAVGARTTQPFKMAPAEYRRFTGGYRLEADPSVLVGLAAEGDWLVGTIVGQGTDFFRPVAPLEFEGRSGNCRISSVDAGDGKSPVNRVLITLRGQELWAKRIEMPPDTTWIDECEGFYYSDEIGAAYEIVRGAEGLSVVVAGSESRPLCPADTDVLVGGIGVLSIKRSTSGDVTGFDFGEPEDFGERLIRFDRCGQCK
jgi:CubicO group peptidase (beta-lactamase class C family)